MLVQLLRHGETDGGARYCGLTDVALSALGWHQMRTAIAERSWDVIVSSPLRRCAAFAETLARELAVPCRLEPDLREMSFGEWEGRTAAELMDMDRQCLERFWADPSVQSPPGGESLAELHARVTAVWQRLVTGPGNARMLIVTHGGPIRLLRAAQLRMPLSLVLQIDVPHGALIDIECLADGSVSPHPVGEGSMAFPANH